MACPVRPGDVIHLEGEVVELTPSKTKPKGNARIKWTAFNQHGEPVYTITAIASPERINQNEARRIAANIVAPEQKSLSEAAE